MSVKVMTKVFDRYPNGGGEFTLALALADNAHDDGSRIFPSVAELARKTRQSERNVQYQLRRMQDDGWLIMVAEEVRPTGRRGGGKGNGRPREYRISADWLSGKSGASIAPDSDETVDALPGANIAPGSVVDKSPLSGANIAPPKMPIGCKTQQLSGAKLLHPNHQLTVKKRGSNPPAAKPKATTPPHLAAAAAWNEVTSALRKGEKPPAWTYPLTDQVLREIGGMQQLGAMSERAVEFKGNDFKSIFKLRAMEGASP